MNKSRKKNQELKTEFEQRIISDAAAYKRSLIREVSYRWRQLKLTSQNPNIDDLLNQLSSKLKLTNKFKSQLSIEVETVQQQINEVQYDYFKNVSTSGIITLQPGDYEKLIASYQVDFTQLDKTLSDTLKVTQRQVAGQKLGYNQFVAILKRKDLGDHEAANLAQTSLSQFDNAIHVEYAQQAGFNTFKWDGPPTISTSHFLCIENVGKSFTISELKGMDNHSGLPVETSLGGFRCRHFLTADIGAKK